MLRILVELLLKSLHFQSLTKEHRLWSPTDLGFNPLLLFIGRMILSKLIKQSLTYLICKNGNNMYLKVFLVAMPLVSAHEALYIVPATKRATVGK